MPLIRLLFRIVGTAAERRLKIRQHREFFKARDIVGNDGADVRHPKVVVFRTVEFLELLVVQHHVDRRVADRVSHDLIPTLVQLTMSRLYSSGSYHVGVCGPLKPLSYRAVVGPAPSAKNLMRLAETQSSWYEFFAFSISARNCGVRC